MRYIARYGVLVTLLAAFGLILGTVTVAGTADSAATSSTATTTASDDTGPPNDPPCEQGQAGENNPNCEDGDPGQGLGPPDGVPPGPPDGVPPGPPDGIDPGPPDDDDDDDNDVDPEAQYCEEGLANGTIAHELTGVEDADGPLSGAAKENLEPLEPITAEAACLVAVLDGNGDGNGDENEEENDNGTGTTVTESVTGAVSNTLGR